MNETTKIDPAFAHTMRVLEEVAAERGRQNTKWGEQNHPSVPPLPDWMKALGISQERIAAYQCERMAFMSSPDASRDRCNEAFKQGEGSWAHILMEEAAEVLGAPDEAARRAELVQIAAVAVAQIESIDREFAKRNTEAGTDR